MSERDSLPWRRWKALLDSGPGVLDGGLATQLERNGYSLDDPLWSARLLVDDVAAITAVHREFIDAGAQVIITASYQVSRAGFIAQGLSSQHADDALVASVMAARTAAKGTDVLVAASVGPFGAIGHDGAEYRGNYGLSHNELVDFHAQRIAILAAAQPDVFAVETIPDAVEAAAIAEVLADYPAIPAWMTFSCADDERTCAGQPIAEAVSAATEGLTVAAVGVNCVAPRNVSALLQRIGRASDLPLVAYPNAGALWVPETGSWMDPGSAEVTRSGEFGSSEESIVAGREPAADIAWVDSWIAEGARLIGGCCLIGPETITAIAARLDTLPDPDIWHSS